jgi:hypothetical protein
MENLKTCRKCLIEKTFDEFYNCKGSKDGKRFYCKVCENKRHSEYTKNEKVKLRIKDREYRTYYNVSLKGYSVRLYGGASHRSKKKNLDFDLTSEWILEKLTPLVCEATGLPLKIERSLDSKIEMLLPTLDRIDSSKGYTKDNVIVTCWWWNVMKQDWSNSQVLNILKQINLEEIEKRIK